MTEEVTLKKLIAGLQEAVANGGMMKQVVDAAVTQLSTLDFEYDQDSFPALNNTENFTDESGSTPANLAEALLWKLGKWKSYKKFARRYTDDKSKPTTTDVVFFAFAQHLRDKGNPIYDQHAIRALWAICGSLTADEKSKCKSLLFNGKAKWKDTASGREAIECYNLFVRHLGELARSGATKGEIDRLLMPLGQAIKKSTTNYSEFHQLCGWG